MLLCRAHNIQVLWSRPHWFLAINSCHHWRQVHKLSLLGPTKLHRSQHAQDRLLKKNQPIICFSVKVFKAVREQYNLPLSPIFYQFHSCFIEGKFTNYLCSAPHRSQRAQDNWFIKTSSKIRQNLEYQQNNFSLQICLLAIFQFCKELPWTCCEIGWYAIWCSKLCLYHGLRFILTI